MRVRNGVLKMNTYLAIDVGGTAIKYSFMNEEAEILEKGEIPTPKDSRDLFLQSILSLYTKYEGRVQAIVMSAPGKIDSAKGYFYTSGALGYLNDTNLKEILEERTGIPFAVENDAKAAALAEVWKGSLKGIENGTVLTLGTAIGGAIILNGKLYRGSTFAAGEYSNIPIHLENALQSHSTWYTIGGVGALLQRYCTKAGILETIDGRQFFEKANAKDSTALEALREYCYEMAGGIYSLQVVLDVERVSIGGGISRQPLLIQYLNEELEHIFSGMGTVPMSRPEIVPCVFGNDANMIGALYHYVTELGGRK